MSFPVQPSADTNSARFRRLSAVSEQCPERAKQLTAYEMIAASSAVRVAWDALECTGKAEERQHFVEVKAKQDKDLTLEDWLTLEWGEILKRV